MRGGGRRDLSPRGKIAKPLFEGVGRGAYSRIWTASKRPRHPGIPWLDPDLAPPRRRLHKSRSPP